MKQPGIVIKTLSNKVIIVGGATGGIGRAVSRHLAREGVNIILAGRDQHRLLKLSNDLGPTNSDVALFTADLTTAESWQNLAEFAMHKFGQIDALVHSLGVAQPAEFVAQNNDEIAKQIAANFTSLIYATKAVLPLMLLRNEGHIVAMGSLGGIVPMPGLPIYSSTKFAVRGFCCSLHAELKATGVSVSLISPGPVETGMLAREAENQKADISFINRPLRPDQVATIVHHVLLHPRRETVLPLFAGYASILSNLIPGLFTVLHALLRPLGKRRRLAFQHGLSQSTLEKWYANTN